MRRRPVATLIVALAMLPVLRSAAEASPESEASTWQGVKLRQYGRNREALEAFQRAYELSPSPRLKAQIALAHQALGEWMAAERSLEEALGASADPWIVRYRDVLDRALAAIRAHLGWLRVESNVAHAELLVGGRTEAELPTRGPIRVLSGTLELEVRAPGYPALHRTIDVAPGVEVVVLATMEPQSAAPAPTIAVSPATAGGRPSFDEVRARPASRTWGYAALGAAGALAVGGLVAWRIRENNVAIYDDDGRCRVGTMTREQRCGGRVQAANVATGVEVAAFVAAGAAAMFGAWTLWLRGAESFGDAKPRTGMSCAPSAMVGIACGGRF